MTIPLFILFLAILIHFIREYLRYREDEDTLSAITIRGKYYGFSFAPLNNRSTEVRLDYHFG